MKQSIQPTTPLSEVSGVGKKFKSKLDQLGLQTVEDLLWHLPNRYEDYSTIKKISEIEDGDTVTVQGKITEIQSTQSWKRKYTVVEVTISDDSESMKAVWFNQSYMKKVLKEGEKYNFSGEVSKKDGQYQFSNPLYEKLNPDKKQIHTGRILPVYPETKGLTSRGIRYLLTPLLDAVEVEETLPEPLLKKESLMGINEALKAIHYPDTLKKAKEAKRRLEYEDLLMLQLYNQKRKHEIKQRSTFSIKKDIETIKDEVESLPFKLTTDQKKALWSIIQDMEKDYPMNRLLQGDVGSGKTVVAFIAAIQAAKEGLQVAFMAPTEILATQHYKTFSKMFPYIEDGVGLLTGSQSEIYRGEGITEDMYKNEIYKQIEENNVKIIIGTHALIQKKVKFNTLGLVIIDEQQRFGVEQRAKLSQNKNDKHGNEILPHFLSMSATPIPRTLSLTVFGDLDMSVIKELPKGRKEVKTDLVLPEQREEKYNFIKKEVEKGRQVFVICPRIHNGNDQSKWSDTKTVIQEYKKLSEKIFPDLAIDMLHGKMSPEEKNEIMKRFSENNESDILVSTSVIEVGIDVPNASIMVIESAERFGLSQLYQFQGRVGRDKHESYCFLFTESKHPETLKRLRYLKNAKNGIELAEKDLNLRGPGEFLGNSQSGMSDLARKAINNQALISHTKKSAEEIFKKGMDTYPYLKKKLDEFENDIHRE